MGELEKIGEIPNNLVIKLWEEQEKIFPSLETVLKNFCERNRFPKPNETIETKNGIMVTWNKEGKVLLNSELKSPFGQELQYYLGGNGSHRYNTIRTTYTMEGKLYNRKVELEAEITLTEDYEMRRSEGTPSCFAPIPVPTGEKERRLSREDNENYWFLTDSKR